MDWNLVIAIATIVIAFATFLQAFVTYLVALYLSRISKDAETVATLRGINEQWQRFNLTALQNRDFCDTLGSMGYDPQNIEKIRRRYVVFYILNIMYDVYYAAKHGRMVSGFADEMTKDHVKLLSNSAELEEILKGDRGYSDEFTDYVLKLLSVHRKQGSPKSAPPAD